jgi:hypothetical protein
MQKVVRQVNIGLNAQDAFDSFVDNFNDWWPKEYTWSNGLPSKYGTIFSSHFFMKPS